MFFDGSSYTTTPGAAAKIALASSAVSFFSVSMFTLSEWHRNTGTRTVVAVTLMSGSSILCVSFTIFISSLVYALSRKTSMCGRQLNAIWCG